MRKNKIHFQVLYKIRLIIRQKKYMCVFQVSALKKLGIVGQHNILFVKIFYTEIAFFNIFSPIFQQIRQHFAHNSLEAKNLGMIGKPETHIYFFFLP